jgi:hypothetical protein
VDSDHKKQWESLTGLKQAKGLIQGPSARRTTELLELNRNQLWWVVGLLTGHCHLNDESATHILCDYEAIAYLRLRHLGHLFLEQDDYHDAPVSKIQNKDISV